MRGSLRQQCHRPPPFCSVNAQRLIPSTIGDRLAVGKQRSHIDETCLWILFLLPQAVYG